MIILIAFNKLERKPYYYFLVYIVKILELIKIGIFIYVYNYIKFLVYLIYIGRDIFLYLYYLTSLIKTSLDNSEESRLEVNNID